jgi:hypothetical protein
MTRRTPQSLFPYLAVVDRQVNLATSSRTPVTVTASATPHTKGAWVELHAATSSLATLVRVKGSTGAASTNTATLVDIGIGAASSEVVIIPDITFGGNQTEGVTGQFDSGAVEIPITIPKGSRISARCQGAQVSQAVGVSIDLFHTRTPLGADWAMASYSPLVTTYGAVAGTSLGVSLTAPGSLNTKGAWTQITASTTAPITDMCASFGRDGQGNSTGGVGLVDIGFGPAGAEVVLLSNIQVDSTSAERLLMQTAMISGLDLPSGVRLVARFQRSIAAVVIDCCLHTNYGKVSR